MGRQIRKTVAAAVLCAATVTASLLVAGPAAAAPSVPPGPAGPAAGQGAIHPGVVTRSEGGQCTANFVFRDGDRLLIGQAAHCTGTGGDPTDVDGCSATSLPLGTEVEIGGATQPGTLVYNSWLAMQASGETDQNACLFNDFALVEIAEADRDRVSAAVPVIGGPTGLFAGPTALGEKVTSYGSSELRGGSGPLSPKVGTSLGTSGGGWTHTVATLTPGIPGDSGSGFLTSDGRAFGVLSTLNLAPAAGTNGVSDLAMALQYARDRGLAGVQLVTA